MKTPDSSGSRPQHLQLRLRMEMLSTAIGFLLRLMDNSTGKKAGFCGYVERLLFIVSTQI